MTTLKDRLIEGLITGKSGLPHFNKWVYGTLPEMTWQEVVIGWYNQWHEKA